MLKQEVDFEGSGGLRGSGATGFACLGLALARHIEFELTSPGRHHRRGLHDQQVEGLQAELHRGPQPEACHAR